MNQSEVNELMDATVWTIVSFLQREAKAHERRTGVTEAPLQAALSAELAKELRRVAHEIKEGRYTLLPA